MEQKLRDVLARRRMTFFSTILDHPIIIIDIGTTSTDITNAEVTYVAIKTSNNEQVITSQDEKQTLQEALAVLSKYKSDTLVGFNILFFDLPILRRRIQFHNIEYSMYFENVLDIRIMLCDGNPYMRGKLSEFAACLGFKEECFGWCKSHYKFLWQDPNIPDLKDYLLYDVRATQIIFDYLLGIHNEKISLSEVFQ
jgi:uncharacterized protein YprB with RNaseH-like and TPR domain